MATGNNPQQAIDNGALMQGNVKQLRTRLTPLTSTTVLTGSAFGPALLTPIRIRRAYVIGKTVGGGAVACTVVVGYGAAPGTIDTIFGTASIADISAISLTTAVDVTIVDSGSDGVPDNQDVAAGKFLLFSTTKASTVTFADAELVVEYVDKDT